MASAQTWPRRSIDIIDDVAGAGARSCEAHTCRLAMIVDVSMTSTRGTAMRCRRTWCKPKLQYLTVDKSWPSDASRRAWSKSRSQHCALNFVRLNHLVPSAEARAACRRIVAGSSQPCLVTGLGSHSCPNPKSKSFRSALGPLGPSPIDSTSKIGYIRVLSNFLCPLFTSPIHI